MMEGPALPTVALAVAGAEFVEQPKSKPDSATVVAAPGEASPATVTDCIRLPPHVVSSPDVASSPDIASANIESCLHVRAIAGQTTPPPQVPERITAEPESVATVGAAGAATVQDICAPSEDDRVAGVFWQVELVSRVLSPKLLWPLFCGENRARPGAFVVTRSTTTRNAAVTRWHLATAVSADTLIVRCRTRLKWRWMPPC